MATLPIYGNFNNNKNQSSSLEPVDRFQRNLLVAAATLTHHELIVRIYDKVAQLSLSGMSVK